MTLLVGVLSCAPGDFGAGAKMANTIANGVACGMAAANGTPCTPQAVLDALERDAAAQREKVSAVAPQAAAVDPALTEKLLAQLEANTESNRAVTQALLALAARAPTAEPAIAPVDAGAPDAALDGAP
jgi:hypothetical protein